MALRNIRVLDDPILRKPCRKVNEVDKHVIELLDDMVETMYYTGNAGGLAANQIGILRRLVVLDMGKGLLKLINPQIIGISGIQEVIEGCLSIPNRFGKLMRPQKVTIQTLNEDGNEIILSAEDDIAKCICHEIDHLDGILFIDKVFDFIEN
jgi:peptide deformylase